MNVSKEISFYMNNLNSIVIIGFSEKLKELVKYNDSLNIKTLLITSPDQKKYIDNELEYFVFEKLNTSFINFIKKKVNIENTLFVSLGARYIFNKNIIKKVFRNKLINFHSTRLPFDAGSGGYSWRILKGDRINNQLVHLVDENIDSGPIIDYETNLFPSYCKIPKDFNQFSENKFVLFYKKFIKKIISNYKFILKYQTNYIGSYTPRLNTKINGFIDWSMDSHDLFKFINAFDDPYDGASTYLNNRKIGKVFIKSVHLHGGEVLSHPFMSGIVSRHNGDWVVVNTNGKYSLIIEKVLDIKGKNIISEIKVGDRFFTPHSKLDFAKNKRIFYSSKGLKK